jgi:hypothetical protein
MDIDWEGDCGVLLRRHAIAQGYDDRTLRRMVSSGELHRIRRGAYVPGPTWAEADPVDRHRLTARAVLLTAHPGAVLTHVSAIAEYDVPIWGVDLNEVHLTRPDGFAGRREAGVVHHCGDLPARDVVIRNRLSISSAARAAIELTTHADLEAALVSINWMLAEGLASRPELERYLETFKHWPNSLHSDLVIRLSDHRNKWPIESRMGYLLWRQGLPRPVSQFEVRDERGHVVAILDFAFPKHHCFIEMDGRIKYLYFRRPGESLEEFILREKRREELVCLLTGWVCIRLTWDDLARPVITARRIRALLSRGAGR